MWDSVRLDDPSTYYTIEWLDFLRQNSRDPNPLVWAITRQRAWQICKNLGIMNHTQRHWRATQFADAMDLFTLKEALHRATMPFEYAEIIMRKLDSILALISLHAITAILARAKPSKSSSYFCSYSNLQITLVFRTARTSPFGSVATIL